MLRIALASVALCAASGAGAIGVRVEPATSGGTLHPRIGIIGKAPTNCKPSVDHVTIDGQDIGIVLHSPKVGCWTGSGSGYVLHVDPAEVGATMTPGTVYRVSVFSDAGDAPGLVTFRLLDATLDPPATPDAPQPENGFWWSQDSAETGPASRSTGMSLEAQGGQLAVGLFGFGDAGNPTWYFGSARRQGRTAVVPLLELRNGDPLFSPTGSRPSAVDGLRLELEFLSPARARAWLVRSDDRRDIAVRAFTFARSNFSNIDARVDWDGRWVLVGDDAGALREFEFATPTRQDADTLRFFDASGATLECRASGSGVPRACTLSGGASPIAEFDQVGLDRLDGRGTNGERVRLMRVSRP
ncbi:hypothetical protein [Dokdonella fugitiva]|uniref:Uncharacterized protein n=1 Tax=Dokdonella fugitiva TaxID=328517 RepID=A0A4R2IBL9_9GAMM|nr:hypothetical protein [Dokdonella fugitiva]TCO41911.1 hypothetical protein EV148_102265 [Dokdonella fugitiva]